MQVRSATICDFAELREGLVFIVAGGITRVRRASFPAPAAIYLAITLELLQADRAFPVQLEVTLDGPTGERVMQMTAAIQAGPSAELELDEATLATLPIDLRQMAIPAPGWYVPGSRLTEPRGPRSEFRADLVPGAEDHGSHRCQSDGGIAAELGAGSSPFRGV